MTPSPLIAPDLFDLSAPSAATIHVTDNYTLNDGDTVDINGGVAFKLEVKNGSSLSLDIAGDVSVDGHHQHAGGVVSSSSENGDAIVSIADTGSISVVGAGPSSEAAGIVLAVKNATVTNDGMIHASADGAFGIDIRAQGAVQFSNTGTIDVEAGATNFGYGFYGSGASGFVSNDGDITVSGGVALAMAMIRGNGSNTGHIRAIGTSASGFALGFGLDGSAPSSATGRPPIPAGGGAIFTNDGDIRASGLGDVTGADIRSAASVVNHGLISAVSTNEPGSAVGLSFSTAVPGDFVQNFGVIRGDYSVAAEDALGSGLATDDMVLNHGKLIGHVSLGDGDDIFSNQGRTQGDAYMGDGDDSFDTSAGRFQGSVYAGLGDDTVIGSGHGDTIYGDDQDGSPGAGGADQLRGMGGDDTILGGDGADTLIGGGGADSLTGGAGDDVFQFNQVRHSSGLAIDTITDLTNTDTIDLQTIDADTGTSGDQAFTIVGSFTHHAGELTVTYDSANDRTVILGDVDGDGSGDLVIIVSGDHHDFTNFAL